MIYWLTNFILFYFILSIPVSLTDKFIYKLICKRWDFYSPQLRTNWLVFMAFANITLISSLTYTLYDPTFIKFCLSHHDACLGLLSLGKLSTVKIWDYLLLLAVSLLLIFRTIKIFENKDISIGLISPFIYKEKLKTILSNNELDKLQVIDSDKIYAYCKGLFKPKIYISRGLIETMTPQQIHIILLHETAHIKRGDLILGALFNFFSIFEGYPKLISFYYSVWKKEREKACDDFVLKEYSPLLVAQTILQVVSKSHKNPVLSAGFGNECATLERIERLAEYKEPKYNSGYEFIFAWLILFSFISFGLYFPLVHCSLDKLTLYFLNFFN